MTGVSIVRPGGMMTGVGCRLSTLSKVFGMAFVRVRGREVAMFMVSAMIMGWIG